MNKNRKLVNAFLVSTMILSNVAPVALAAEDDTVVEDETNVTRLAGDTRVGTALEVSDFVYDSADTVVVAGYHGEVDALTGTVLSAAKDAPMLLVSDKEEDIAAVNAEIKALGAKNVVLLGDDKVISQSIEDSFKADGLNVDRVAGHDRFDTAVAVAEAVNGKHNHVFLTNDGRSGELADALSAGPASGRDEDPILLTSQDGLPSQTIDALKAMDVKRVTIVGGDKAVSDVVESELADLGIAVGRVAGDNRWETAQAVAETYFPDSEGAIVANDGRVSIADALVGGYFGAEKDMPILLTLNTEMDDKTANYLGENASFAYILGGHKVVSKAVETQVEEEVAKELGLTDAKDKAKAAVDAYELDTEGMTEESIKAANAKLAELKADAKKAIDALDSIADVEAFEFDASAAEDLLEEEALNVKSVSAINANELLVTFSQEVDKATAQTITNYTIDGKDLKGSDAVTLNDDKKSVTIKFSTTDGVLKDGDNDTVAVTKTGLLDNKTAYTVAIKKGEIFNADKTEKVPAFSTGLFFNDTEKPTVDSVKVEENGDVVVTFSEKLTEENNVYVTIDGEKSGELKPSGNKVTVKQTNDIVKDLEKGKTFSIFVEGAEDLVGHEMNLYKGTFEYDYSVVAPVLETVTAKDEKTIEIEFNKDVAELSTDDEVEVYLGNSKLVHSTDYTIAKAKDANSNDLDNKYEITLVENDSNGTGKVYANNATTAALKVVAEGYKDTLTPANLGTKVEKTVTLEKDTTKPALDKAKYDSSDNKLTVQFTKELDNASASKLAGKLSIIGEDGVLTNVVESAGEEAVSVGQLNDKDKSFVITNGAKALSNGNYTLIIEKNAVTDKSLNKNGNNKIEVPFTITDQPSAEKPVVNTITSSNVGEIVVKYTNEKVGVSATNPANYAINGKALAKEDLDGPITLNKDKDTATIKLKEGFFAETKNRIVTVSNVTSVDGVEIDEASKTVSLKDNTKPELLSGKVVDGEIVLGFNEDVSFDNNDGSAKKFEDDDFVVNVNGNELTTTDFTVEKDATNKKQLILKSDVINFTTATTLTVSTAKNADAADAAGNVVVQETTITIK